MAEEIKTEAKVEQLVNLAPVETQTIESSQPTQQEIQGKKVTTKKKVNRYNKEECLAEIKRLEKNNGTESAYYKEIKSRLIKV